MNLAIDISVAINYLIGSEDDKNRKMCKQSGGKCQKIKQNQLHFDQFLQLVFRIFLSSSGY